MKTDSVVFREDLYPRIETSPTTVQKYAEDLSVLPPIEVNQHGELIDGWHRWTAHKKNGAEEVPAIVTPTTSDAHLLELAIERNAKHGLQLSQSDKRDMAVKIYGSTPTSERDEKKEQLAKILSVSVHTVRKWTTDIDRQAKEDRNRRILKMWMECWSLDEIGEAVGLTKQAISLVCQEMTNVSKLDKPHRLAATYEDDFEPQLYNVWRKAAKTNEVGHFGNSEATWLDNLVYALTQPFDVVIDPFAGGGSTLDVCRKRMRRCFISDRKPIEERKHEIRQHDLIAEDGSIQLPKPPQWKDVRLVYLDPPYWKQAEGKYSDDPTDLANMPLDKFNESLAGIINGFAAKLRSSKATSAYIALIIQPTQWKSDGHEFVDHVGDMLRAVNLPVKNRISAPYQTEQYLPQQVTWAKEKKEWLVLTREIIVWRAI